MLRANNSNSQGSDSKKKRESFITPSLKTKHEETGTLKVLDKIDKSLNETLENSDRMQNFKFYFVQNNYEKILKKIKRKRSPLKRSSHPKAASSRNSSPDRVRRSKFGKLEKISVNN